MKNDQKRINLFPWIHRLILSLLCIGLIIWAIYRYIVLRQESNYIDYIIIGLIIFCFIDSLVVAIFSALTDGQTGMLNDDAIVIFAFGLFINRKLSKYTAVFMNLKNYKLVNRIAGSVGGDQGLEIYGKYLKKVVKKGERIARLGGDSFIALIKNQNVNNFLEATNEVKINVFSYDGIKHSFKINTRYGLYALKEEDGVGSVFDNPTVALNMAKAFSKDVLWYDNQMAEMMFHDKEISSGFKDAIKNGEFNVYYQPKVNVEKNALHGCEALVRWVKNGKVISPGEFIPALENSGLIINLDFYVFEQVCKNLIKWKDKNYKCVRVSSNFSKVNLQNPDFAKKILDIVDKYQVDKSLIEIELTESANYGDYSALNNFLKIMKENNISTAIDDFGVGYSSLELLKNLNVDVVKIDKRFIDNIEENGGENSNIVLVKHILNTCIELNKEVVCEGVETIAQKEILKTMKCETIQGYLYDKPLNCEEFEQKLINPSYSS